MPGRSKAALLFCLLISVFCTFYLANFIAVLSNVSICLVCDFSIVATCPSAYFAFCLCSFRFVFVVPSWHFGEPKQK